MEKRHGNRILSIEIFVPYALGCTEPIKLDTLRNTLRKGRGRFCTVLAILGYALFKTQANW